MDWLVTLFELFKDYLYRLLKYGIELLKELFFWAFQLIMWLVNLLLEGVVAILEPMDISQYLTGIPPAASWMLSQIGLPQGLSIIGSAILVRISLQLIPFTRLGS